MLPEQFHYWEKFDSNSSVNFDISFISQISHTFSMGQQYNLLISNIN